MVMASTETRSSGSLRPRNLSVPSDRPSMLPLLSSPLRMFSPLPALDTVSPRPDRSGGSLWRWDRVSPTTFSPCGREGPSPDALGVFRRELGGLCEATPSIQRLLRKARTVYTGRLHQPQGRSLTQHRNTADASFRTAPSGKPPLLRNRHSAMSN
jgi:hypothetical protein